mmetsp:Transcript_124243/g.345843  ORF Transcript_124243/g.345843 Transcript_124243/m.345843 type:complete len:500 (+) Transcript_124243:2-1501(+)
MAAHRGQEPSRRAAEAEHFQLEDAAPLRAAAHQDPGTSGGSLGRLRGREDNATEFAPAPEQFALRTACLCVTRHWQRAHFHHSPEDLEGPPQLLLVPGPGHVKDQDAVQRQVRQGIHTATGLGAVPYRGGATRAARPAAPRQCPLLAAWRAAQRHANNAVAAAAAALRRLIARAQGDINRLWFPCAPCADLKLHLASNDALIQWQRWRPEKLKTLCAFGAALAGQLGEDRRDEAKGMPHVEHLEHPVQDVGRLRHLDHGWRGRRSRPSRRHHLRPLCGGQRMPYVLLLPICLLLLPLLLLLLQLGLLATCIFLFSLPLHALLLILLLLLPLPLWVLFLGTRSFGFRHLPCGTALMHLLPKCLLLVLLLLPLFLGASNICLQHQSTDIILMRLFPDCLLFPIDLDELHIAAFLWTLPRLFLPLLGSLSPTLIRLVAIQAKGFLLLFNMLALLLLLCLLVLLRKLLLHLQHLWCCSPPCRRGVTWPCPAATSAHTAQPRRR